MTFEKWLRAYQDFHGPLSENEQHRLRIVWNRGFEEGKGEGVKAERDWWSELMHEVRGLFEEDPEEGCVCDTARHYQCCPCRERAILQAIDERTKHESTTDSTDAGSDAERGDGTHSV